MDGIYVLYRYAALGNDGFLIASEAGQGKLQGLGCLCQSAPFLPGDLIHLLIRVHAAAVNDNRNQL